MKKIIKNCITVLLVAVIMPVFFNCKADENSDNSQKDVILLRQVKINSVTINNRNLGTPGTTASGASEGKITLTVPAGEELIVPITAVTASAAVGIGQITTQYAVTAGGLPASFSGTKPAELANNDYLWLKISSDKLTQYYVIKITVKESGINETGGFGVPDPEFAAKYPYFVFPNLGTEEILTEAKLPEPGYWNNISVENGLQGHIHAYPDPFHFANGNKVVNLEDWENRRKELRLLVSYYMKGRVPSLDPDVVTITLGGNNNRTITVKHNASGRTTNVTVSVTPNATVQTAANWGKLGLGTAVGHDGMGLGGSWSGGARGDVATLYGIASNLVSRDSAAGWAASVVLIAIEGVNDDGNGEKFLEPVPDESMSWFTPYGPLSSSGYSTNGKLAMYTAAFAHGRKPGTRFGYANIGDSGAGGAAIERFVSPAGFRLDVTIQEALGYSGYTLGDMTGKLGFSSAELQLKNPNAGYGWPVDMAPIGYVGARTRALGLGGYEDLKGYPYYMKGIANGDQMYDPGMPNYGPTGTDGNSIARARSVRGWSPYWETFHNVPTIANDGAQITASTALSSTTTYYSPYVAWQTDGWGGIQNMNQIKGEDGSGYNWHGELFKAFLDIHEGLDLDHARSATGARGKEGFACNVPLDVYFALMLQAPYGVNLISAGVYQMRTNQPSMWANWLLTDEVYKMYGELEYADAFNNGILVEDSAYPGSGLKMGWDKYVWRNTNIFTWQPHWSNAEANSTVNTAHRGYALRDTATTEKAKSDIKLAKLRDPFFQVDDPVTYLGEFHKMDWGRPGSSTIAERVARRVEPVLRDYFLGEQYHAVPGRLEAATYHNNAKSNYTPTGPQFKPMDWKGLTEQPENQ